MIADHLVLSTSLTLYILSFPLSLRAAQPTPTRDIVFHEQSLLVCVQSLQVPSLTLSLSQFTWFLCYVLTVQRERERVREDIDTSSALEAGAVVEKRASDCCLRVCVCVTSDEMREVENAKQKKSIICFLHACSPTSRRWRLQLASTMHAGSRQRRRGEATKTQASLESDSS